MNYLPILTEAAQNVGIAVQLLISVCTVESNLINTSNFKDPHGGSHGICQVSLRSAREFYPNIGINTLKIPEVNASIAAQILREKLNKYKKIELVIASYNSGSPRYNKGKLINALYVQKVMDKLQK